MEQQHQITMGLTNKQQWLNCCQHWLPIAATAAASLIKSGVDNSHTSCAQAS
jgi:hypothetical protein